MPFIYRNLVCQPREGDDFLVDELARQLDLAPEALGSVRIIRKGVDARRKPRIKLVFTLSFEVVGGIEQLLYQRAARDPNLEWQPETAPHVLVPVTSTRQIVIAGSGPAGLFAALRLSQHGLSGTLIERGQPVEQRALDVQQFWRNGRLDPESNVQFGEGGAGTFSDGKLTCRTKDPLIPWILEQLVTFGANGEIRYQAKPHIGTDQLRTVIATIRRHLTESGFSIRFGSRLSDIGIVDGRVRSVQVNGAEETPCDTLILATGHSARDTYELLESRGVVLQAKPFAIGLRVEHPQELIDRIQYGGPRPGGVPVADYAVTWNNRISGRSAYSFCMCPGGVVIGGASEYMGVVTNGMSGSLRNSPFANSALVVNVGPADFPDDGPLAGVRFQRHWERQAYLAGGGGYKAPAQSLLSFLGRKGASPRSTYRPGIVDAELDAVLPGFVTNTLREGIPDFDRVMKGFITREATLIGIESRTSAPVRILRDDSLQSVGLSGLFPAGEGAGYAGGIMSSAVDGVRIADMIIQSIR